MNKETEKLRIQYLIEATKQTIKDHLQNYAFEATEAIANNTKINANVDIDATFKKIERLEVYLGVLTKKKPQKRKAK